ncbi:hypothetical protein U9M48_012971, partial [Paspalum notatum var. saurae]
MANLRFSPSSHGAALPSHSSGSIFPPSLSSQTVVAFQSLVRTWTLVHRLDRDCSGVLVLGRTQLSASIMHAIFREKTADALADGTQQVLQRKYVALVIGRPRHPKGLLSAPLAKVVLQDGKSDRLTVCAGSNTACVQDALTEYRVIESCQGYTWLELFPRTGRKHQLRIHCAEVLGTPIVGDYKYGRQAHQNWTPLHMPQTIDDEMLKKRKLPFGLALGGGSVGEKLPQLHLHCKQMVLPNISAAMQQLQSSGAEHDFSDLDKLNFVAPLPLHMQLSWKILNSIGKYPILTTSLGLALPRSRLLWYSPSSRSLSRRSLLLERLLCLP